jgi:actin-related protein
MEEHDHLISFGGRLTPKEFQTFSEIAFDSYRFPLFVPLNSTLVAAMHFSQKNPKISGILLDIGHCLTCAVAFSEGSVFTGSFSRIELGGKDLIYHFMRNYHTDHFPEKLDYINASYIFKEFSLNFSNSLNESCE